MTARLRPVYIVGAACMPVTRTAPPLTIAALGGAAIRSALADCATTNAGVGALVVGNMLGGMGSHQQHVGALLATSSGLSGVEAITAEACMGSGGMALRLGAWAVAGGIHETVVVAGVEVMTNHHISTTTRMLASASDWASEGSAGETFVSLNGTLMGMYMKRHGVPHAAFGPFAITAHRNALTSPHAVIKKPITIADCENARTISDPIKVCPVAHLNKWS